MPDQSTYEVYMFDHSGCELRHTVPCIRDGEITRCVSSRGDIIYLCDVHYCVLAEAAHAHEPLLRIGMTTRLLSDVIMYDMLPYYEYDVNHSNM